MRDVACRDLAEVRSAFVDDALGDDDRDRLLAHLVGCDPCRADVQELRALRQLLGRVGEQPGRTTSPELSSRLVSIAGHDAYAPMWSRPFRRTRGGVLPSHRRTVRIRAGVAGLTVGALVSALIVAGYVWAPPAVPAVVGDPAERVRSEFAAGLAQLPLTSESVAALMVAPADALTVRAEAPAATYVDSFSLPPLTGAEAEAALRRAADDGDGVGYAGQQTITVRSGGGWVSASVGLAAVAGRGSVVSVLSAAGGPGVDGFVPAASSRAADDEVLGRLLARYRLRGWSGGQVLGRSATVVEAVPARRATSPSVVSASTAADTGDGPAARWWVDDVTGLLLWQEAYDASGVPSLSAGFTRLAVSTRPVFREHLAPRLTMSSATASLTLSDVPTLTRSGWPCPETLAGLPLVRLRSDQAGDPDVLHLVYSDGVTTLSVLEQRGRLAAAPAGSHLDPGLAVQLRPGTPTIASWSSGDLVISVATDGDQDLLAAAVRSLPHAATVPTATMGRVRAGWNRVWQRVVG